jgi:hypothetical protein
MGAECTGGRVKKARITKAGAKRLGRPDLEDKTVEYEPNKHGFAVTGETFYKGVRIGRLLQWVSRGKHDPVSVVREE